MRCYSHKIKELLIFILNDFKKIITNKVRFINIILNKNIKVRFINIMAMTMMMMLAMMTMSMKMTMIMMRMKMSISMIMMMMMVMMIMMMVMMVLMVMDMYIESSQCVVEYIEKFSIYFLNPTTF